MEQLLEILEDIKPGADFTRTDLFSGGVLKSFDMMQLVLEIGEEFDVEIPMEYIIPENFESAEKIMALIEKLQ